MNQLYDTSPMLSFSNLCDQFGGKALQSPTRSTVPLLSLVQHSQPKWNELLTALGAPLDAPVHFEYQVASPKPGGRASQTDALVMSHDTVWGIEAKWTEPRYETVAERFRVPAMGSAQDDPTLAGWLSHLRPYAPGELRPSDFDAVVYQVLHRAASAAAVATAKGIKPALVYLHFVPSSDKKTATTQQYVSDLGDLHSLLGDPADYPFYVVEMPLKPTPAYRDIEGLDKSSPASAAMVTAALCRHSLFDFGSAVIQRIGSSSGA